MNGATTTPSDRLLTTLAILKVNQDEGYAQIDSYLPFLFHCLGTSDDEEVSTPALKEALKAEFEVDLPQAVLKTLLSKASEAGKVRLDLGVYRINRSALDGCDLNQTIGRVERGRLQLIDALREFTQELFTETWDEKRAKKELHTYIDGFSSRVLAAAISGGSLQREPPNKDRDQYVVQRFAGAISERNHDLFEMLLTLVKGRMLADALYYVSEHAAEPPSLKEVEVYLDGPPLLFVLGYAGPESQGPYSELLEMLKRQSAVVRCFDHSVTEAREILDAAAARANTGQTSSHFHGDVVAHLVRSGKSAVDIEMLANRLENDLLHLAINPVTTPAHKANLQPDETRLAEQLQKALHYSNPLARDRDIDSLTAVFRLRDGRAFRDIEKSRAIFVTHNFNLFRTSANFFRTRDRRAIPPCVYDMSLTTMLWLREPAQRPDLPRERLVANAYAALNPDDRLWEKYNTAIDHLRQDGHLTDDDATFLRYGREAQEALMDETRGDHEAFTEGSVEQIIARSRDNVLADTRSELSAARQDAEHASRELAATRQRIHDFAKRAGQAIAWGLLGIVAVMLLIGAVWGPVGPVSKGFVSAPVQLVCGVAFIGMGITTMFFRPSLFDLRNAVAVRLQRLIQSALFSVLRLKSDRGVDG
jgi:hypothetical protein